MRISHFTKDIYKYLTLDNEIFMSCISNNTIIFIDFFFCFVHEISFSCRDSLVNKSIGKKRDLSKRYPEELFNYIRNIPVGPENGFENSRTGLE